MSLTSLAGRQLIDGLHIKEKWIGQSAADIKSAVIRAGGWPKVFNPANDPKGFPRWLHQVRPMFNQEPKQLIRLSDSEAKKEIFKVRYTADQMQLRKTSLKNDITDWGAPSSDVYYENYTGGEKPQTRNWIEYSQSGTRYHSREQLDILLSALRTHKATGAFKMCWPDGTGGSCETVLINWGQDASDKRRKRSAGEVGQIISTDQSRQRLNKYTGSYNYADTMVAGFDEHDWFDIVPDTKFGTKYVKSRYDRLKQRIFKQAHFDQIGYGAPTWID